MRVMQTEWKKLFYGKKYILMILLAVIFGAATIGMLVMSKQNQSVIGVMQAYYEAGQAEPGMLEDGAAVTIDNSIGYMTGCNDWDSPQYYELFRSSLFATFAFVIFCITYISGSYAKEYRNLTLRQEIFCGYAKMNLFFSKFITNNALLYVLYLFVVFIGFLFGICYTGFASTAAEIITLFLAGSLNMICILVYESMAVLLVSFTENVVVPATISILWFFSSFMVYPMLHQDLAYYGNAFAFFTKLSPGTYLYRICSYTKELDSGIIGDTLRYMVPLLLVLWMLLLVRLRKQEI